MGARDGRGRRGGGRRRARRARSAADEPDTGAPIDDRDPGLDAEIEAGAIVDEEPANDTPAPVDGAPDEPSIAPSVLGAFQALVDQNPLGALVVDDDARVVLHNAAALRMLGTHHDDLVNGRFGHPVTDEPAEVTRRDAKGALHAHVVGWTPFDGLGRPAWLVTIRDVADGRTGTGTGAASDDDHFGGSTHDPLTGLPGRELLLNHVFESARRSGSLDDERFALVVIDLERFGRVNEAHGHSAGDRVLETVAARLTSAVRPGDYVSRLGGDEFAIVLPPQPVAAHRGITDRLEEVLARPIVVEGAEIECSPVIGIAEHVDADDEHTLLERAIAAMVASGPGSTNLAARPTDRTEPRTTATGTHASGRVCEGEIFLAHQPIFALADNQVSGLEALARLEHPDDGIVVPDESVRIELEGGAVLTLGEWVIRDVCEQIAMWRRELPDYLVPTVNINLSRRDLSSTSIRDHTRTELARHGLEPSALRFEITEEVLLDRDPRVEALLRGIVDDGVGLVLDLFGTGLSALTHLQLFPLAGVKIDRSFVMRMMTDETAGQIVLAAIDLGRTFELPVTAVGVETGEQKSVLERLGCDHVQGFLLARPVSAVEASRFFERDPASLRVRPRGPVLRSSGAFDRPDLAIDASLLLDTPDADDLRGAADATDGFDTTDGFDASGRFDATDGFDASGRFDATDGFDASGGFVVIDPDDDGDPNPSTPWERPEHSPV